MILHPFFAVLCAAALSRAQSGPLAVQHTDSSATAIRGKGSTLAVMDFEGRSIPADQAITLTDRFRSELAPCGKFRLVERSKMDEILREQGFQQSGCTSTECAVQTGRLLGVDKMISGSVAKLGETWTVNARVIDVGTSEILQTAVIDRRGPIDDLLTSGMASLANRLLGNCPGEVPKPKQIATAPVEETKPVEPIKISKDSSDSIPLGLRGFPMQVAIVSPWAFPVGDRVNGLAVSVVYGHLETLRGIQAGVVNHVGGLVTGIQGGAVNLSGELHGIQGGMMNISSTSKGMQAGLINVSGVCKGIQFGLINIWKTEKGDSRLFPFIGCGF